MNWNGLGIAVAFALLMGCAAEGDVVADGEKADRNGDGIGGHMGACYDGSFRTGEVCERTSANYWAPDHRDNWMQVEANASASYVDSDGTEVSVDVELVLYDEHNGFDPEATVPVVFRAIICRLHNECSYRVVSRSVTLVRDEGTRKLRATTEDIILDNSWGAPTVDLIQRIDVLVPGVGRKFVLPLSPGH